MKEKLHNAWKLIEQYAVSDAADSTRIISDSVTNLFNGSAVFPAPLLVRLLHGVVDKVFPEPDVPADLATARIHFDAIFDVIFKVSLHVFLDCCSQLILIYSNFVRMRRLMYVS